MGECHLGAEGINHKMAEPKVVAENIPGVKAVKDHMVWVEPMSGMAIEAQDEAEERAKGEATPR